MASIFDQAQQKGAPQGAPEEPSLDRDPLSAAIGENVQRSRGVSPEENPIGMGTEPATDEENARIEPVLTAIERQIHGPFRDDIMELLDSTPELWLNVASASESLLEGVHQKLAEQQEDFGPEYWFGENGIIQTTVEMVYELAVAGDTVNSSDSNQLDAAYMKVVQQIGDELFTDDDAAAAEAQQLMVDLEFGEGASDLAAEGFELGGNVDDFLPDEMAEEVGPTTAEIPQGV